MENFTPLTATIGGLMIGLSAAILLALNGRIAGISGILAGGLQATREDGAWRWLFLLGMVLGALLHDTLLGTTFTMRAGFPASVLVIAGFLVGFGTRLGSGCTSGHGVCGIGRLSPRSITATGVFLVTAMITVYVTRHILEVNW